MTFEERGPFRASVKCSFEPTQDIELVDTDIGQNYNAAVLDGGTISSEYNALIVAGSGVWKNELASRNYGSTTAKAIFNEICSDAGLTLSSFSDQALLATSFDFYSRATGSVRETLGELCDDIGADWVVTSDGQVQVLTSGYELELSQDIQGQYLVLDHDFTQRVLTLSISGTWLMPGVIIEDQRVKRIVYTQEQDLRAQVYY